MDRPWPPALPPLLAQGPDWLVIDKPAGLAVHAGPRTADCLEARLAAAGIGARPVHRLDRDTSGCLLLATRAAAVRRFQSAFERREIAKTYWAIIINPPAEDEGQVAAPLAKVSSRAAGWRMVVDPAGRPAVTSWRVIGRRDGLALIALHPQTGRTHQLRVHATLLAPGSHIAGDPIYGAPAAGGLMLHARSLAFPAGSGEMVEVQAGLPDRFPRLEFTASGN